MNFELAMAIATFSFVTSVTPGPNNTFLLTSGANFGVRRSLPYAFGILAGLSLIMIGIGAGLGVLFATLPVVYQTLKYVGFAYMLYIAYQIVRSTTKNETAEARYIGFGRATIFQFVNPKAWIVTASLMASFIPVNEGLAATVLYCLLFLAFTFPGGVIWALFGHSLKGWLSEPRKRRIFNITAAVLLVASMVPVLFLH
jgi:threonine/homoserine/homoserine lactone efflux protein